MSQKVAVFGGTDDGLKAALMLAESGIMTRIFVFSEFGDEAVEPQERLEVAAKRFCADEITDCLVKSGCAFVIDAMHPYARGASKSIQAACARSGIESVRLIPEKRVPERVAEVATTAEAAALLNKTGEKVLLTLNVKELAAFSRVKDGRERLFARIPPGVEALQKCVSMGFGPERLVCMKGPFNREMNAATIRWLGVSCVVTKDSGHTAGLFEKLAAAEQTETKLILIREPVAEAAGIDYNALCTLVSERFSVEAAPKPDLGAADTASKIYFPLFVNLHNKRVLIVGGGETAYKKIKSLFKFTSKLCVISTEICSEIEVLVRDDKISWLPSGFSPAFLQGADLVVAADSRGVNHCVGEAARAMQILVNVADSREESSFQFPSVVQNDAMTAGVLAKDNDYTAVMRLAQKLRDKLGGGRG